MKTNETLKKASKQTKNKRTHDKKLCSNYLKSSKNKYAVSNKF